MSAIRFDHIAVGMPSVAEAVPALVGILGGVHHRGARSKGFTWHAWRYAGGGKIEVIEPLGPDGFLRRFLAERGPGFHHVTFAVPSLAEVCERARRLGYDVVGRDESDPSWMEAFLHPRQALGIVVQFAESRARAADEDSRYIGPPPLPETSPPPVTVLGLRMRARSRERADTQWVHLLGGSATPGEGGAVIYRWPDSPLHIVVEIDPAHDEGPQGIEFTSPHPLVVPGVLGPLFIPRSSAPTARAKEFPP